MTVSNEDRDTLVSKLRDSKCIYDMHGDLDTPSRVEARLIAGVVVSHGWGPRPLAATEVSANQCHCPENGLIERDTCNRGHCRSCHACDCDVKPTVSRAELEALMPGTVNDLAEYLRTQVGIEVTE